jgi:transcriptional regulator with XRE-family HTH domain
MNPDPTGAGTGTIAEPAQKNSTATAEGLAQKAGEVRDEVRIVGEDVEGLHGTLQTRALDARTAELAQGETASLLSELASTHGLSWRLIGKLLGVSQTSIRKWRRGESVTPEHRRRIAMLLAFLERLHESSPSMCEEASWLEMRISEESTLTPADLYAMRRYELLFDLAGLHRAPHEVLVAFDPGWRVKYGVDERYEVQLAADGQPSIVVHESS